MHHTPLNAHNHIARNKHPMLVALYLSLSYIRHAHTDPMHARVLTLSAIRHMQTGETTLRPYNIGT